MMNSPRIRQACLLALLLQGPAGSLAADDGASTAADAAAACSPASAEYDWIPKNLLSAEQQRTLPVGCDGAFIEPASEVAARVTTVAGEDADQDISISGKDSQLTRQSTIMTGDVVLIQGTRKITGDTAELFNEPQGVQLDGHVTFREPGFLLRGDHAKISLEQGSLEVSNARYVLHEQRVHGKASEITRDEQGIIRLKEGTYSSCSPEDEIWYLKTGSLMLDPENGQGEASHVRLEVLDVPVFYFPWMRFPIGDQRHSGFLAPSFARSEDGLDVAIPYYLNLAPNYDAVVVPRYISDRGSQIGVDFRHLSSLFNTTISGAFLSNDDKTGEDRWLAGIKQTGGTNEPWFTLLDITRVSDDDYFEDLDAINLSVSRATDLSQRGVAGYMTDHWTTQVAIQKYQRLSDNLVIDPYEKLPELRANGAYQLGQGFYTRLDQIITAFDHEDTALQTGERIYLDYSAGWRSNWQAGFIEPAIYSRYLKQQLDNTALDDSPEVLVPAASLDMGLSFVRHGNHYTQTLEPRVYHYYADRENQDDFALFDTDELYFSYDQLFRSYRFAGHDRIGDANQTSVAITSRWLDNVRGNTWLELGIGQVFYHQDRLVTAFDPLSFAALPVDIRERYLQPRSPLAASAKWWFHSRWHLSSELAWNDNTNDTRSGNVFMHYAGEAGELFSVGYRHVQLLTQLAPLVYVEETATQADISALWPINGQWSFVGRSNYDFNHNRQQELLAGLQYEDCCWRLRTVYRQWASNPDEVFNTDLHEEDRGIYLEIQFKNLAGLGTKTTNMLEDSIYGYHGSD